MEMAKCSGAQHVLTKLELIHDFHLAPPGTVINQQGLISDRASGFWTTNLGQRHKLR